MVRIRYQLLFVLALLSCVKSDDFSNLEEKCSDTASANKTVQEVLNNASSTATKYTDEDFVEGYVVSSDQHSNFFKILSLQTLDGSLGFSVAVDQTDLYTHYNPGRRVIIQLKNSYTEIDNGSLEIGTLFIDKFNNETVGRITYPLYESVLIRSCDVTNENSLVNTLSIEEISDTHLNTLVEFTNVQFHEEALGTTLFSNSNDDDSFATNHVIEDPFGNTLIFRTSAFADFAKTPVPTSSGTIRGVLTKFKDDYQLLARSLNDLVLTEERFTIELKNNIFFTELADPDNNASARFIEIYNAEDTPVNLNGWTILRYTNASTDVSSTLDLSGNTIHNGQYFVIAANASEFETVFGFAPDLAAGSNSPAGSNGDDNLVLVDSEGTVVDVFGIIGEDGSGTNHEFEDGRALRNNNIVQGNAAYTFSEWQIWNDTGANGTINMPQNAPNNFTPGTR